MSDLERATRTFDALAVRVDAMGLRSLGFTSTLLGEGVSTIALGTALSLGPLTRGKVLVVDANWIQPSLTADAHLESAPGLAEYLADRARLDEVIRPGSPSRPAFLPIGERSVARPTMRALSTLLTTKLSGFQTVLVDLPPVLSGEPFVLPWASVLDQLFVVLREAATPLPLVRSALEKVGVATPAHIVLNRAAAAGTDSTIALLAARA